MLLGTFRGFIRNAVRVEARIPVSVVPLNATEHTVQSRDFRRADGLYVGSRGRFILMRKDVIVVLSAFSTHVCRISDPFKHTIYQNRCKSPSDGSACVDSLWKLMFLLCRLDSTSIASLEHQARKTITEGRLGSRNRIGAEHGLRGLHMMVYDGIW